MSQSTVRVLVWGENLHEERDPAVRSIYPQGMHNCIAAALGSDPRIEARTATLQDPDTVWFSFDTQLGKDVIIGPNVVFGPDVIIGDNVEIRAFCHIEGANVDTNAIVGPFARLRPGSDIGPDVHIGNFVEVKEAVAVGQV